MFSKYRRKQQKISMKQYLITYMCTQPSTQDCLSQTTIIAQYLLPALSFPPNNPSLESTYSRSRTSVAFLTAGSQKPQRSRLYPKVEEGSIPALREQARQDLTVEESRYSQLLSVVALLLTNMTRLVLARRIVRLSVYRRSSNDGTLYMGQFGPSLAGEHDMIDISRGEPNKKTPISSAD
jgi:hypothetical protein